MFLSVILVAILDECQTLPSEVLETIMAKIMAQFMDKNARIEQPAYRLAVQVCNSAADKLMRHVSQIFAEIIVAERDNDFEEIRTAHELIERLYHSCPAVLITVIPQLEEELQAEELQLRLIVTQVLGEMLADKCGGVELIRQHPTTWSVWLKRKNAKSPAVRLKFVQTTRALLESVPEQRDVVKAALRDKLFDPDEKVRAAVCRVYSQLDYETTLHHVGVDQLREVAERGIDKKAWSNTAPTPYTNRGRLEGEGSKGPVERIRATTPRRARRDETKVYSAYTAHSRPTTPDQGTSPNDGTTAADPRVVQDAHAGTRHQRSTEHYATQNTRNSRTHRRPCALALATRPVPTPSPPHHTGQRQHYRRTTTTHNPVPPSLLPAKDRRQPNAPLNSRGNTTTCDVPNTLSR
ncbi:hypothetical protein GGX14DRAFT_658721 [Mycena pura]|uniref:Uncharacterized protein n=1 Tax=Mycena pura TaxID=153505 RepID=A0AAD6V345_9AGAR|nr:hypothetical protein GGX14DRAFT_658721 [Mycena pura]